jgi:hypothetical protein
MQIINLNLIKRQKDLPGFVHRFIDAVVEHRYRTALDFFVSLSLYETANLYAACLSLKEAKEQNKIFDPSVGMAATIVIAVSLALASGEGECFFDEQTLDSWITNLITMSNARHTHLSGEGIALYQRFSITAQPGTVFSVKNPDDGELVTASNKPPELP